mmetsp:Transcript_50702/g.117939  ORF Transcript_50702/g.117939 Transcript_50702/m.117939 type:complete len:197 (+) Transcript_50702:57-647(+)
MSPSTQCSSRRGSALAACLGMLPVLRAAVVAKPSIGALDHSLRALHQQLPVPTVALAAPPSEKEKKSSAEEEAYVKKCAKHIKKLVSMADKSYTDTHLEQNLVSFCKQSEEHPISYEDGFKTYDACVEFAAKLVAARERELKGEPAGYTDFCRETWEHRQEKPTAEPAPPVHSSARGVGATALSAALACALTLRAV